MKDYLLKIFNYNHWSNEMLLECMQKNQVKDEYILKMLSHILNAQHRRYNELTGESISAVDLWKVFEFDELVTKNNALTELYIKLITRLKLGKLNAKIETKSLDGDMFYMTVTDILIHLANHGSHHRGQIASRLRELGTVPPNFSYLAYAKSFPDFW